MQTTKDFKIVMVIDEALPLGLIANTAAVLALSLGKEVKDFIGEDLTDKEGIVHAGLTGQPVPILKKNTDGLRELKKKSLQYKDDLFTVDVTDVAQKSKEYADYKEKLKDKTLDELTFLGIAFAGPTKLVTSLTGNLRLLR
ncbi:MAG: DUF2000 domain-containing protein [Patescibacteria group bacterium]